MSAYTWCSVAFYQLERLKTTRKYFISRLLKELTSKLYKITLFLFLDNTASVF